MQNKQNIYFWATVLSVILALFFSDNTTCAYFMLYTITRMYIYLHVYVDICIYV